MRYHFGEYLLDTQLYALWNRNTWTPLRPKIFAVLLYLIRHRDHVVSKTELLEHVWPGQLISDGSLNACLMAVRKALGDTGQTQRYIQTRRGYGYRFVAPVHEEADASRARQQVIQGESPGALPASLAGAATQPVGSPLDFTDWFTLPIPSTLQEALMARLDRFDAARRLAQVGAIIGREFSYTLLQAITALEDATLQPALARLVATELVYQQGLPPQSIYIFKHALIRDAAYQSIPQQTRQYLHARLVQLCADAAPLRATLPPALLAHHATQAGLWPQALAYWQQAGAHALRQGAYHEAMSHLQRGFALLNHLSAGPARLRHETELSLALTPVMLIVHGAGGPEVERLTTRTYALSQQLEQSPALFPALRGLHYVAWTQGQLQTALELAERLLELARSSTDAGAQLEAHLAMGTTLWYGGRCGLAIRYLEQGLSVPFPTHRLPVNRVPHPELGCLLYSALVLWYLGYPDQAHRRVQKGLTLAAQLAQPHHLVWGQHLGAMFYMLSRQRPQAQVLTEAVVQAATAHGITFAVTGGQLMQERTLSDHDLAPLEQYQPLLAACRTRNGPLGLAQYLVWL